MQSSNINIPIYMKNKYVNITNYSMRLFTIEVIILIIINFIVYKIINHN